MPQLSAFLQSPHGLGCAGRGAAASRAFSLATSALRSAISPHRSRHPGMSESSSLTPKPPRQLRPSRSINAGCAPWRLQYSAYASRCRDHGMPAGQPCTGAIFATGCAGWVASAARAFAQAARSSSRCCSYCAGPPGQLRACSASCAATSAASASRVSVVMPVLPAPSRTCPAGTAGLPGILVRCTGGRASSPARSHPAW